MATATISWKPPRPTVGGLPVAEESDLPRMRPRTRASDKQLADLLAVALDDMASSVCTFWACEGPRRPRHMMTCRKCWAMRAVATVQVTLAMRRR